MDEIHIIPQDLQLEEKAYKRVNYDKRTEEADTRIIQGIQQEEFPKEAKAIKTGLPVKTSSKLASLCPIYENGLLKVGGRQPSRHPVILQRHTSQIFLLKAYMKEVAIKEIAILSLY